MGMGKPGVISYLEILYEYIGMDKKEAENKLQEYKEKLPEGLYYVNTDGEFYYYDDTNIKNK